MPSVHTVSNDLKVSVPKGLDWPALAHAPVGQYAMIENPPGVAEIIAAVLAKTGGEVRTVFLSRIVPGQEIPPHTDNHDAGCKMRVHVPLTTNPKAWFISGGKKTNMKVGSAYAIDPTVVHGVKNEGRTDRIHLMFNVIG